jgi:hypothetical protein
VKYAFTGLLPFMRSKSLSRRRVVRWCRGQGVQLLRWREAKLREGPLSWEEDASHYHYRIQVMDAAGRRRGAYLTFDRRYVFARCTEVLWDDPRGRRVPGAPRAPLAKDDEPSGLVPVTSVSPWV